MSSNKSIKEAIDLIKEYRNHAQAVADAQLELLSTIVNKATELSRIPFENRTVEQNAMLDFYWSFTDKIDKSLDAADNYNKSLDKYVKGFNNLNKIVSSENESK